MSSYNIIVVKMIPPLLTMVGAPWGVLPPGVHHASLADVDVVFATNPHRRHLFAGLLDASTRLKFAGCQTIYLDGSYVSGKPHPGDFDACWDPVGIDLAKLHPVFLDFNNGRAEQKKMFMGEFFPSSMLCQDVGATFLDFFQIERSTGNRKGLLSISLSADPLLSGKVLP